MSSVPAAVSYATAIHCYSCVNCDTPFNPVDCNQLCPVAAGCIKYTAESGEGIYCYK